jgi:hypothetical protein
MTLRRSWYPITAMLLCAQSAASERVPVPSPPATWSEDFRRLVEPTDQCPGGTIAQIRERAVVSAPYSPREIEAFHPGTLPIPGIQASDRFYSFYSRSELSSGTFWAFGGYALVRGSCIIHAVVDTYDN